MKFLTPNDLMQLLLENHACAVLVDLCKGLAQVVHLLRRGHLDEHVHGGTLEETLALVALEPLQHVLI